MSLDKRYLKSLLNEGFEALTSTLVDSDMLFDVNAEVFNYIKKHAVTYGKLPDLETIENDLKISLDINTPEPLKYYEDKLIERKLVNNISPHLKNAVTSLESGAGKTGFDSLKDAVVEGTNFLAEKKAVQKISNMRENVQERLDAFESRKNGLELGISTPWQSLTNVTNGFGKAQLWAFIARLKTGKSFLVSVLAKHFYEVNETPLVVSLENPVEMFERRTDAMIAKVGIDKVRKGQMSTVQELHFKKKLKEMSNNPTDFYVAGNGRVRTVADIEMLYHELKPSIILIDGFYLLKTGDTRIDRDKYVCVAHVVNLIQSLTQRLQIPIILTSQFNRDVTKKKTGSADKVAFSYELPQACDVLVSMDRDEDDEVNRKMRLSVIEIREGSRVEILMNWDLESMDFSEVGVLENGVLVQGNLGAGEIQNTEVCESDSKSSYESDVDSGVNENLDFSDSDQDDIPEDADVSFDFPKHDFQIPDPQNGSLSDLDY